MSAHDSDKDSLLREIECSVERLRCCLARLDWKSADNEIKKFNANTESFARLDELARDQLMEEFRNVAEAGKHLFRMTTPDSTTRELELQYFQSDTTSSGEISSDPVSEKLQWLINTHAVRYLDPYNLELRLKDTPNWLLTALMPCLHDPFATGDRRILMSQVPGWLTGRNELLAVVQDCGAREEIFKVKLGINWLLPLLLGCRIQFGSPATMPKEEAAMSQLLKGSGQFDYPAVGRIAAAVDELWPNHRELLFGHAFHLYDRFSQQLVNPDVNTFVRYVSRRYGSDVQALASEMRESRLNQICVQAGKELELLKRTYEEIGFIISDEFVLSDDPGMIIREYKIPLRFAKNAGLLGDYFDYRRRAGSNWPSENSEINMEVKVICMLALGGHLRKVKSVLTLIEDRAKERKWDRAKKVQIKRRVFLAFRKIGRDKGRLNWDSILEHLGYVDESSKMTRLPKKGSFPKNLTDIALTPTIVENPLAKDLFREERDLLSACTRWAVSSKDERTQ